MIGAAIGARVGVAVVGSMALVAASAAGVPRTDDLTHLVAERAARAARILRGPFGGQEALRADLVGVQRGRRLVARRSMAGRQRGAGDWVGWATGGWGTGGWCVAVVVVVEWSGALGRSFGMNG